MPTPDPTPLATAAPYHTADDLRRLQRCLDDSYRRAGEHLVGIHTDAARLDAATLVGLLPSMHVMVVATTSSDGRPFTGPVDAFLHHGRILFGTAAGALRARHLARRPATSVTYVEGEGLVVTMHGQARPADLTGRDADAGERLQAHYGGDWSDWGRSSPYFLVEPDRLFAADMRVHARSE